MKRLVVCCDGTWNTPDQAHLESGGRYEITAAGAWFDASIRSTPGGYRNLSFLQRRTERFRRSAGGLWFELTGEVDGRTFPIGRATEILAEADGELVCWANDVRIAFGNNSGSVDVTVTRRP